MVRKLSLSSKIITLVNKSFDITTFIGKLIQHIPDQGFKMIRYYGFLANRVRGVLLNVVYYALNLSKKLDSKKPTYVSLMIKSFGIDPMSCVTCKSPMNLTYVYYPSAFQKIQTI